MLCCTSPDFSAQNQPKEVIILCRKSSCRQGGTRVYLRCSSRVWFKDDLGKWKRRRCGLPLTVVVEGRDGIVEMICPECHTHHYSADYASRFIFPSTASESRHFPEPPSHCPGCRQPLNCSPADVRVGQLWCGGCGAYISFHSGRKAWEIEPAT